MYLLKQLQFCEISGFSLRFAGIFSFQFVSELISRYISSFSFYSCYLWLQFIFNFEFCNILILNIIIYLYYFCSEFFLYWFCFYFYRFGWSVISCNHKTTKLFGGCMYVCVWLIFKHTHSSLWGFLWILSLSLNKLSSLRDVDPWGFDTQSFCLISIQANFFFKHFK